MRAVCRSVAALVLLLALGSCSDIPTESPSPARPSFAIADGAHGGNPHVFFLPPLLDDPSSQFSAPFDGSLDVKIVICIWRPTDKVCGPALVAFDQTTNAGSEMVRVPEGEEYYQVNWQPDAVLDQNPLGTGEAYRIQVLVGNRVAAFADLQVVGTARELKSVSTGEFIPLLGARTLPIKVRIEEGWETWGVVEVVETGGWHSCKLTTTGAAYCWGYGEYGQLGNNGKALAQTTPVPVVGNHAFTALSAGQFHTCGLTLDGTAYCWGYNAWGQLGDNSTVDMAVPVMVAAGGLKFTALTAGGNHTCALATGGAAYCWGANGRGQLGVGGFPYSRQGTPMPVAGGLAFTSLTAGGDHTCGIATDGLAYCWGFNGWGQLGNSSNGNTTAPVAVSGGLSFVALSAGGDGSWEQTCGLTMTGAGYCWGRIGYYQGVTPVIGPKWTPTALPGAYTFGKLDVGAEHGCGITLESQAYCWGIGSSGQLGGGGSISTSITPVQVSGGHAFAVVSVGNWHSCGITPASDAYCWGYGGDGALGTAGTSDSFSPVAVVEPAGGW